LRRRKRNYRKSICRI